jgi:HSP20 family protein
MARFVFLASLVSGFFCRLAYRSKTARRQRRGGTVSPIRNASSQEIPFMAKDNQSSQSSGRQQTSEMAQSGSSSAQQGANPRAAGQQSGWQSPDKSEQSTGGALQQRRGLGQFPSSYYGGFGGGPLSMIRRVSEDMDRLFDAFGFGRGLFPSLGESALSGYGEGASSLWAPHIEVFERDGKFFVSADLPGVKKEDVKVEITQDAVTIQGQRKQEKTSSERGFYRSERSYGSFYRTIPLPDGANTENASATFRDGVLQIEIEVPQQKSSGRTLEIKDAAPARSATGESQQMAGAKSQQQR